jgi:hypothetical protein
MKFVVTKDPFFAGLQHDIVDAGHEWYWWPTGKPAFDVFDEEKPDVVITTELTTSMLKCWNDNIIAVQPNAERTQIRVNNKEFVLNPMVDTHAYQHTEPVDHLRCELARVGPINDVVRRLCYPVGKYNIKIFGDDNGGGYGVAQYLGKITHQEECQVYASALMTYVETIEEALKVVACGGCPVTTNKLSATFAEQLDCYGDELYDLIHIWSTNPDSRNVTAKVMYDDLQLMTEHHYQFLAMELLEAINDIHDNQK